MTLQRIVGLPLRWPTTHQLVINLVVILGFVGFFALLNTLGVMPSEQVALSTAAIATGSLLHSFGVNLTHGPRAVVVFMVVSTAVYLGYIYFVT